MTITFSDVSLRDHFLVEIRNECGRHLSVTRFVVHGQLDQDGDDHPSPGAQVHEHLLEREQDLHGVIVLEELKDQRLYRLPHVFLAHLRSQGLVPGLAYDGRGSVDLGVGLVVRVVVVDPGKLQFTAKLAPSALTTGTT